MSGPPGARRASVRAIAAALCLATLAALASVLLSSDWPEKLLGRPAPVSFHGRDVSSEDWDASFALSDLSDRQRSLSDFRGKVVLLAFGYTHCPDVCPTTLAKFAEVRRALGADGARVQGLFVTVDPGRDTAEVLRRYVPSFDPTFIGLRGTESQTDAAARSFHANYQIVETGGDVLVDHTASTYVIDPAGKVRIVAPYDQSARALADDVRALLRAG